MASTDEEMTKTSVAKTALALAICALAAIAAAPASASTAVAPGLRVASVSLAGGPNSRLVVVVPPLLAGQQVPPSAFRVTQAGRRLPVTVRRVADTGLDVYVLLDTTIPPATLAAAKSAAADLLRNLPAGVRTATADAGLLSVPPVQPGTAAALRSLATAHPLSTTFLRESLSSIVSRPTMDRRRVIVLLTDCREQALGDLIPIVNELAAGDQQLDIVAPGSGCPADVSSLASSSGGLAMVGGPVRRLDQAVDNMLFDILGQYRLSLPSSPDRQSLTIAVDSAGIRASAVVPSTLTTTLPAPEGLRQPEGDSRAVLAGLATIAAVILAAQTLIVTRPGRRAKFPGRWSERTRLAAQPSRPYPGAPPGIPGDREGRPSRGGAHHKHRDGRA